MTKKTSKAVETPQESSGEISTSIAVTSLTAIRDRIRDVLGGEPVPGEDSTAYVALLGQKAVAIAAEQRKAEQADRDSIRELSPSVVLSWVRMQTPEYRARLAKDVVGMDATNRKSVLGA